MPITHNDGRPVNSQKILQTLDELIEQFGPISIHPGTGREIWPHDSARYKVELIRISRNVDNIVENRKFVAALKLKLLEQFEAIDIYICSYLVDIE